MDINHGCDAPRVLPGLHQCGQDRQVDAHARDLAATSWLRKGATEMGEPQRWANKVIPFLQCFVLVHLKFDKQHHFYAQRNSLLGRPAPGEHAARASPVRGASPGWSDPPETFIL